MEQAFGTLLFVVVGVAAVIAVVTFAGARDAYRQIGKGALSLRDGTDRPAGEPRPGSAQATAEQRAEVRQMLEAKSARRVRRGEPPLDVDAVLADLLDRPQIDAGIERELRDLVEARNARRLRRGEPALDVEAEVARRLSELA